MHAWVEHTAELQLELEAPTQEEVFAEAFALDARAVVDLRKPVRDLRRGGIQLPV